MLNWSYILPMPKNYSQGLWSSITISIIKSPLSLVIYIYATLNWQFLSHNS